MKKKIYIFVFILLNAKAFSKSLPPAGQSFYWGRSGGEPHSLGYTGVSELSGLEGSSYNSASLANIKRIAHATTIGGFGTPELFGDLQMAFPSDYGIFAFDIFFNRYKHNGINPLVGFDFRWAKPLSHNLFWGSGFHFHHIQLQQQKDFSLALDSGIIYQKFTKEKKFGFLDPSIGFSLRGVGKPSLLKGHVPMFPFTASVGGGSSFIKLPKYQLRMLSDIHVGFTPMNFGWSIGLQQRLFDVVLLNMGYNLATSKIGIYNSGAFHFGFGFLVKVPNRKNQNKYERAPADVDIKLLYTISQNHYEGKSQWSHFLRLDMAWGYYDDKPPNAMARSEDMYFSPNYDNQKDFFEIKLQAKDNVRINRWQLKIIDKENNVVQVWKSLDPLAIKKLTFKKFFSQIAAKKIEAEVPSKIIWDGQNKNGRRVGDGEYYYVFQVWDDNDNFFETGKQKIILDNTVPRFEAYAGYQIFSPNGDKAKDILEINFLARDYSQTDQTYITILNKSEREVKSFFYEGIPPEIIVWDGKDNQEKIVPAGIYSIVLKSQDFAGNHFQQEIKNIHVVTDYEEVFTKSSLPVFSPNQDGYFDFTEITTKVTSQKGLENWKILIGNENTQTRTFEGKKSLPNKIIWDGKDNNGILFSDGIYSITTQLYYDSGNFPLSPKSFVEVDTTSPQVEITKPKNLFFSPNEDGHLDVINFRQTIKGKKDDRVEILFLNENNQIVLKKDYTVKTVPSIFTWDGKDQNNKKLPQGYYTYKVVATDSVQNSSSKTIENILLKTDVEEITLNSLLSSFSPNQDGIKDEAFFEIKFSNFEELQSAVLFIRDAQNKTIKNFQIKDFNNAKIIWDGTNEEEKIAPDGSYFIQVQAKYSFGEEAVSKAKNIVLQTQPSKIIFSQKELFFLRSTKKQRKEFLQIEQKTIPQTDNTFVAEIKNARGKVIKSFSWQRQLPPLVLWDGHDDNDQPVADGLYYYILKNKDSAGNHNQNSLKITLVSHVEKPQLALSKKGFSPSSDKQQNNFVEIFYESPAYNNFLKTAEVIILNEQGQEVQRIKQEFLTLQNKIIWYAKDSFENILPSGDYFVFSKHSYFGGYQIKSDVQEIRLDSRPPQIKITTSAEPFTPDGDGKNDYLFIAVQLHDDSAIKKWVLKIRKKNSQEVFKTFDSENFSLDQPLVWDGFNDAQNQMVESLQVYDIELQAEDIYQNKNQKTITIKTGVLLESRKNHWLIRLSNLENFNAKLSKSVKDKLDKTIYLLRKILTYPQDFQLKENFHIKIYSYSFKGGVSQTDKKLQDLVYDYLVEQGFDSNIFIKLDSPLIELDKNTGIDFILAK